MKRILISNEERERILEMHVNATKRNYLAEQDIATEKNTPDDNNRRELYNKGINELKNKFLTMDDITTIQNFISGGNYLQASNPLTGNEKLIKFGIKFPDSSQRYCSVLNSNHCSPGFSENTGNQKIIMEYMLNDIKALYYGFLAMIMQRAYGPNNPNVEQYWGKCLEIMGKMGYSNKDMVKNVIENNFFKTHFPDIKPQ